VEQAGIRFAGISKEVYPVKPLDDQLIETIKREPLKPVDVKSF
jgi:hypothetical protein